MKYVLEVLAIASYAYAQSTCPDGKPPQQANGDPVCCNGDLFLAASGTTTSTACVIGCTSDETMSAPSCFPMCEDGEGLTATTSASGTCTTVPLTASDYTSLVYGAKSGNDAASTGPSSGSIGPTSSVTGGVGPIITKGPVLPLAGIVAGLAML